MKTVGELIVALSAFPRDAQIRIHEGVDPFDCWSGDEEVYVSPEYNFNEDDEENEEAVDYYKITLSSY